MANKAKKRIGGLRRNQHLLYVGIFTVVAVMLWVAGSLFQSQRRTGISRELQLMAIPLNPNINTFAIDRIEQKQTYSDQELAGFEIFVVNLEEQNQANSTQPAEESASLLPLNAEPVADSPLFEQPTTEEEPGEASSLPTETPPPTEL